MTTYEKVLAAESDAQIFDVLLSFLEKKKDSKISEDEDLKKLIDGNSRVWSIWNSVRWHKAAGSTGVNELSEYFGESYIWMYDSSWALAKEWKSASRESTSDIESFYASTSNYIYNSVIFYESGDRKNLKPIMTRIVADYEIENVLDFGCSVGNDGLDFIELFNLPVTFIDFNSPSMDFLQWRLNKRKIDTSKYNIVRLGTEKIVSADLLWAVDVLEHMVNPLELLGYIDDETQVVAFFVDDEDNAQGRHPFHFSVNYIELGNKLCELNFKKSEIEGMFVYSRK